MANGEVVVGVDVSTARLDVAWWPGSESFSVSNDVAGVAELFERMVQLQPQAVVIEASGGPEDLLVGSCARRGLRSRWLIRARCASSHAVLVKLAKTDRLDALVLAQFGHSAQATDG